MVNFGPCITSNRPEDMLIAPEAVIVPVTENASCVTALKADVPSVVVPLVVPKPKLPTVAVIAKLLELKLYPPIDIYCADRDELKL